MSASPTKLAVAVDMLTGTRATANSSSAVEIGKRSSGDAQVPVLVLVASFLAVPRNRAETWSEGDGRADVEAEVQVVEPVVEAEVQVVEVQMIVGAAQAEVDAKVV